jgi:hypothetical protein
MMSLESAVICYVSFVPLQVMLQGAADYVPDIDAQEHYERWGLNPPTHVLHVPVI